jgi:Uma2 family endonuclease
MVAGMMAHARAESIGRTSGMHMALSTQGWTRADLERLPDDGNRYEIIDGALLVTPAPLPAHERIIEELGWLLDQYCRRFDVGRASRGKAAMVTDTSHVEPDILVRPLVSPPPERWDDAPLPMLVVEVLSESSHRHDLVNKRAFYLAAGVPEYWVIDGTARTVHVMTAAGERIESVGVTWQPSPGQPALEVDLRGLFEAALGRQGNVKAT